MVFLVREDIHCSFPVLTMMAYYRPTEQLVLLYRRILHHRNIQNPPA